MKIVYLYKAMAAWGGIERVFADKMNYLAQQPGYEVYMLTTDQGQHPMPYPLHEKVHFHDLGIRFHTAYSAPMWRRWLQRWVLQRLFLRRLKAQLRAIDPDVLIVTSELFVTEALALKGRAKVVVECHSSRRYTRLPTSHHLVCLRNWARRRYLRHISQADALVTLSQGDAEAWADIKEAVVMPNVVHLNPTDTLSTATEKRVIFVGRMAYQKGIPYLLEAWSMVHEQHPDWQLDLYGEGEDQPLIEALIASDHAGQHITLHPPTPHIFERYCQSSLFVLPSVYEPFGLVIPEAMSCALPVVAFDCPYGPRDIVNPESGFLIPCYDTSLFAWRICQLIEHPALRQRMGYNAMLRAQAYHESVIMPAWMQFFESLVAHKG